MSQVLAPAPLGDAGLYDALLDRVQDLCAAQNLRTAHPDRAFAPDRDSEGRLVPYARVAMLPSMSSNYILQVDLVWPQNSGLRPPTEAADRLAAALRVGTVLEADGFRRIRVVRDPWQSPALIGDGEVRVPLRVQWTPWR